MMIVSENFGDSALAANIHRDTIGQAVAFVEPISIKTHSVVENNRSSLDDFDIWIDEHSFNHQIRRLFKVLPELGEIVERFN